MASMEQLVERAAKIHVTPHSSFAAIRSFTVYPRQAQGILDFENWLFPLLWERKLGNDTCLGGEEQILRIKGILSLKVGEGVKPYALQVVQDKYDLEPLNIFKTTPTPAVIFIGIFSDRTESLLRSHLP